MVNIWLCPNLRFIWVQKYYELSVQILTFDFSCKKLYERCIFVWTICTSILYKSLKNFGKIMKEKYVATSICSIFLAHLNIMVIIM